MRCPFLRRRFSERRLAAAGLLPPILPVPSMSPMPPMTPIPPKRVESNAYEQIGMRD
jgi:hypothetical protein